jgi:hypothetical protein
MGTIIRLTLAALVLYGCFQVGRATVKYYRFQDAVEQMLLFSRNASDADLVQQVLEIAGEHDVPLEASNISIRHESRELRIEMAYDEDVSLVPGVYARTWRFQPSAMVRLVQVTPLQ